MTHFNFNAGKEKQIYKIGIKELRQIDPAKHNPSDKRCGHWEGRRSEGELPARI